MCAELFAHVFSDKLSAECTHDFSIITGNPRAVVIHILYHLLDNELAILGVLTNESNELFLGFFREYLSELVADYMLNGLEQRVKKCRMIF